MGAIGTPVYDKDDSTKLLLIVNNEIGSPSGTGSRPARTIIKTAVAVNYENHDSIIVTAKHITHSIAYYINFHIFPNVAYTVTRSQAC